MLAEHSYSGQKVVLSHLRSFTRLVIQRSLLRLRGNEREEVRA